MWPGPDGEKIIFNFWGTKCAALQPISHEQITKNELEILPDCIRDCIRKARIHEYTQTRL